MGIKREHELTDRIKVERGKLGDAVREGMEPFKLRIFQT